MSEKYDKYIWHILLAAFFLSGFLHVAFYGVPYTDSIIQIFDGAVILYWLAANVRRIVDKRVRLFLVGIASLMLIFFAIQMMKYKFFQENTVMLRYLWYCFYISMIMIPLCIFLLAIFMSHPEEEAYKRRWFLMFIPAVLLLAGILTNDLHFLTFRFPQGLIDETGHTGTYTYGPLYYVVILWEVFLVVTALLIILRKCGTYVAKKSIWLPVGTLLGGGLLMLLGVVGVPPKIHGITIWQLTEVYNFTIILFLESCIQIGMIPANTGYGKMLGFLKTPALSIYDTDGKITASSASFMQDEGNDWKIESMEIYGGRVDWKVDLSEIHSLNQQIMEVTSQIESRNERLRSENQMKEEQAALNARNRLYDQIADIVKPQLSQMEALLVEEIHKDFDRTVAQINVLNAYIKRRSNMELLKADTGRLPVSELIMAIRESMEYLKNTGITCSVCALSQEELSAELVICAYELFERVLETCLETSRMAAVFLTCKNKVLQIRMMIETKEEKVPDTIPLFMETYQNPATGVSGSVQEERQDEERIVMITLQEGGAL